MSINQIRIIVRWMSFVVIALLAVLTYEFSNLSNTSHELEKINQRQLQSWQLATELRQSSDDLTRLVRTYTLTGDTQYERQYQAVLDIRNGKIVRPENYHRVYWDFMLDGQNKPRPDSGQRIALQDLMKSAGFTEAEFAKLKESEAKSNGLVALEIRAMNAMKGKFADESGNYTRTADPDPNLARELVHSKAYHQFKAGIMKPFDEFFVLAEERTKTEALRTSQALARSHNLFIILMVATLISIALLIYFSQLLTKGVLGCRPRQLEHVLGEIAAGNLAIELPKADPTSAMGRLAVTTENLRKLVRQLHAAAQQVGQGISLLKNHTDLISENTGEMNSIIRANAVAVEELTVSIAQIADNTGTAQANIEKTSQISGNSVIAVEQAAAETGRVQGEMSGVGDTMSDMARRSDEISSIVGVIKEIADQTNLLALNAAIEAARAGEQGRGFAVVADEVRKLAERTGQATVQISGMITAVGEDTKKAHHHIEKTRSTVKNSVESTAHAVDQINVMRNNMDIAVTGMVKIADATREQSLAVSGIAESTEKISAKTQSTDAQVQKAVLALDELQKHANSLIEVASRFRI